VVFHDKSVDQTSNIPIGRTPLGILLADHVRLQGDVTVTAMQHLPGQIQVGLVRTASPGDGTLTLIFADNPLTLRQWTVLDAQRRETRVTLYNVETGGQFDPKLFEFTDPRAFQPGSR
jgi:outer membrane lipoprotein-sorting protein